jgi:hypothetical protein
MTFLTVAAGIIAALFASEIGGWTYRLATWLTKRSAKMLPGDAQARYEEEWISELQEISTSLAKLLWGIRLLISARRVRKTLSSVTNKPAEYAAGSARERSRFGRQRIALIVAGGLVTAVLAVGLTVASFRGSFVDATAASIGVASAGLLTTAWTLAYESLVKRRGEAYEDDTERNTDDD